jgi:hypothetical protein
VVLGGSVGSRASDEGAADEVGPGTTDATAGTGGAAGESAGGTAGRGGAAAMAPGASTGCFLPNGSTSHRDVASASSASSKGGTSSNCKRESVSHGSSLYFAKIVRLS